jgi:hypothetical protein
MAKKQENSVKKLLLRLPKKTFLEVEKRAESMSRSVNGQIVYELNQK